MKLIFNKIINRRASKREDEQDLSFFDQTDESDINNIWPGIIDQVGQLSVDVIELKDSYLVVSTVAGVNIESIEIAMNSDMLTIKGSRVKREIDEQSVEKYLYQECFWGKFARSIILPKDILVKKIKASLEDGILTIVLPIDHAKKETIIKIKEK